MPAELAAVGTSGRISKLHTNINSKKNKKKVEFIERLCCELRGKAGGKPQPGIGSFFAKK